MSLSVYAQSIFYWGMRDIKDLALHLDVFTITRTKFPFFYSALNCFTLNDYSAARFGSVCVISQDVIMSMFYCNGHCVLP